MHRSSATAEVSTASMNAQPGSLGDNELLPEVLRSIGAYLRCWDVLAARRTCNQWADALAPLVTQLRVPLGSNPISAPSDQLQGTSVTGCELTDAAQQLSAALERLPRVHSVTLLLSPNTSSQELQQALQVVGCKSGINTVYICEMPSLHGQLPVDRPRGYTCGLKLCHLRHVTDLRVHTLALSLADVWQQLATLDDDSDSSRSSDADAAAGITAHGSDISNSTCINRSSNGSSGSAMNRQQSSANNSGYALRSLTIHQHPGASANRVVCDLQQLQLPRHLTQLVTPLPGQYNTAGEVVCPLNKSHGSYVQHLAAGFPFLKCLRITDVYEGDENLFKGFKALQELHVELGGIFRSLALDIHSDVPFGWGLLFATQVGQLQRLELRPAAMPMALRWWKDEKCGYLKLGGLPAPFKLEWLKQIRQLQHLLAVHLMPTGEDLSGLDGQLRSLSGCCMHPSEELLLKQVYSVGSALTSLELYHSSPDLGPGNLDERCSLGLTSVPVPLPASQLSELVSLTLIGKFHMPYTVKDPHALWEQLPALRCLKLQFVKLGPNRTVTNGGNSASAAAEVFVALRTGAELCSPTNCAFRASRNAELWIEDLPCQQLQELGLAQYKLVVKRSASRCLEQQGREGQEGAAAHVRPAGQLVAPSSASEHRAGCSSSRAAHNSSDSGVDSGRLCSSLYGLRQLSLVDCTCWVAEPTGQTSNSRANFSIEIGCPSDMLLLLLDQPMANSTQQPNSNLKCLELWDMHLGLTDMELIMCSPLADQLEQLSVRQNTGFTGRTGVSSSGPSAAVQQAPDLDAIVAAAVKDGRLQQLKVLFLQVPDPACVSDPSGHGRGGRVGHFACCGNTEQGPLPGEHCDCFRHLPQLRF